MISDEEIREYVRAMRLKYLVTCRKCRSEDVVFDISVPVDYGGETGWGLGHVSMGCNACKANDFNELL